MAPDPQLLQFVRENLRAHGVEAVRQRLTEDGVDPEEIDAALAAAVEPPPPPPKRRRLLSLGAMASILLTAGFLLNTRKQPSDDERKGGLKPPDLPDPFSDSSAPEERIFRGHYGYILKLPPGYEAEGTFADAGKTQEVVHVFPKGTDPQHLINEGLFGHLGIMRLEVAPRRVPQGLVGVSTLAAWTTARLTREKAKFQKRDQSVHGMPGFIIDTSEPFPAAKAYVIGQKVFYTLTAGAENNLFTGVLASIEEVSPHDDPGK